MFNGQRKSMHIHAMIQNQQTIVPHLALKNGIMNPKIWKNKNQATGYQLLRPMQPKDHKKFIKINCKLWFVIDLQAQGISSFQLQVFRFWCPNSRLIILESIQWPLTMQMNEAEEWWRVLCWRGRNPYNGHWQCKWTRWKNGEGFCVGEGGFGEWPKCKEKKWQKSNSRHS